MRNLQRVADVALKVPAPVFSEIMVIGVNLTNTPPPPHLWHNIEVHCADYRLHIQSMAGLSTRQLASRAAMANMYVSVGWI